MTTLQHKDLLNAGVHFGHLTRKRHPNMDPFIFMERNGIHIIDLNKTLVHLQEATHVLKSMASAGKKILFVATKKQAKALVAQEAARLSMPYVTERWLGGTLTNFATIRRLLKKMASFEKFMKDKTYQNMAKKEQLMIARENAKLERLLQGIAEVTRLPAALFVVDIKREHIAVKEAHKLGIPVFALIDTNADPNQVDYPIPSNDDASSAIELIIKAVGSAIEEGLAARKNNKEAETAESTSTPSKGNRERNVEKIMSSQDAAEQAPRPKRFTSVGAKKQGDEPKKTDSVKAVANQSPAKATAAEQSVEAETKASSPADAKEKMTVATPPQGATKTSEATPETPQAAE